VATAQLLEVSRAVIRLAGKVVIASSANVYGNSLREPITEDVRRRR